MMFCGVIMYYWLFSYVIHVMTCIKYVLYMSFYVWKRNL